jgi:GNAT superfamily N-acetyltransferase
VAYRGLMPDELLDDLSVAQREEMWRTLTAEAGPAVSVAVEDGAVVGFCAVVTPSRDGDAADGVAEIGAIYVDPQAWRRGVGRALMDAALCALRAAGCRWVTLWALVGNHSARDFYARFGLVADGTETTEEDSGAIEVRLRGHVGHHLRDEHVP